MMCRGSKVRDVLRTGPLAIRYSGILHCITWPITLCVSEWFIAQKPDLAWQTVENEWAIVLYVLRLGLQFDTYIKHAGAFWGTTACKPAYRNMYTKCWSTQKKKQHTNNTDSWFYSLWIQYFRVQSQKWTLTNGAVVRAKKPKQNSQQCEKKSFFSLFSLSKTKKHKQKCEGSIQQCVFI